MFTLLTFLFTIIILIQLHNIRRDIQEIDRLGPKDIKRFFSVGKSSK